MDKQSLVKFFKAYSLFVLIAVVLFLAALLLYDRADENPQQTVEKVDEVIKKLQGQPEASQRQLILLELERERNDYLSRQRKEHLAEALLLAGMMIITVEGLTRYMASKEESDKHLSLSKEIRAQAEKYRKTSGTRYSSASSPRRSQEKWKKY